MFSIGNEAAALVPLKSSNAKKISFVKSLTKEVEGQFAYFWLIENLDPADARNKLNYFFIKPFGGFNIFNVCGETVFIIF